MKKIYSILMVGALMSSLVACGVDDNGNNARTNQYQGHQMGTDNGLGYNGRNDTQGNNRTLGNNGTKTTRNQATRHNGGTNITAADDNGYKGYFNDVAEGQWFTENIEWAKDTGLMGGYPGGTFQPNKGVTRAEIAAILSNLAEQGYIDIPDETDETPATDTTPGDTGAATPGDTGAATPGDTGAATPGDTGAATPGDTGAATPGDTGAATPGDTGAATPGDTGAATPGNTGAATP